MAAARGATAKSQLLEALLRRATPLEAKYIIKIITTELRIGLKESLVEEAIAKAYEAPPADVKRANMLVGDILEGVFTQIVPVLVPAVFMALHVFVSLLQAYIFMLLPAIYISLAVSEEH